jgi:streptogramin lyase
VDGSGDVYVADTYNSRILREVFAAASYTESVIATSSLNWPSGIAVDAGGNVYIADTGNNRVLKETPLATGYSETVIPTSTLSNPAGVAVDSAGDVYIADTGNNRVLVESYSTSGYTESSVPTSTLASPFAVAVDGSGNLYIADTYNNRVLEEAYSAGGYAESILPTSGLYFPFSLATDGTGSVYIADTNNSRILKEALSSGAYTQITIPTSSLNSPAGVAVDGNGDVFIADTGNARVLKENLGAPPSLSFANTTPNATSSDSPQTMTVSNIGNAALSISVPSSGNNPSISENFSLNSSGTSACPLVSAGASGPGSVAAGASCFLPISFMPTTTGTLSGSLVLSDNALNAIATQTIQLNGTGTGSTSQTITFGSIAAQSANTTLALTATASSGLPVGFASTTPTVCTVSGTTASLLIAGTCSIQATQPGDGNYAAATPVTQSFTVNLATQTITFNSIPDQLLNTSVAIPLTATASSELPVSFASTTSSVCTTSGSTVSMLTTGTCTIQANQAGDGTVYAAASDAEQSFSIAAPNSPAGISFGSVNIGSTSSTVAVNVTFSSSGTLGQISMLTEGVTGLDFANASGGTCTVGTVYTAGGSCTSNVTFSPTRAGNRLGAVVLEDSTGNVIASAYIQGTGNGPQITFLPGLEGTISTSALVPAGVVVDGNGNVYVLDSDNNQLLQEAYSGGTYNENSVAYEGSFSSPSALAIDGSGVLYVADTGNNQIAVETPSANGYVQTAFPSSQLNAPSGVAVDGGGDVYIADTGNSRILIETPSNGSYTESILPTSQLDYPMSVAVDGKGDVYLADMGNNRILVETLSGEVYSESVLSTSPLSSPTAVAIDPNGNIYIADSGNNRILKEAPNGSGYSESSISVSGLNFVYSLAPDGNGNVYVADAVGDRVLKEDFSDPPTLGFIPAAPGSTSSDSPQTITLENIGDEALTFPIPEAGSNPTISDNFALNSTAPSACPLVPAGASGPGSLAAGAVCVLPVSFTPSEAGTFSGTLVINDNALNATAVQTIQLNGTGTGPTQQTITFAAISTQSANSSLALAATASSGLTVAFASTTPTVCTVSGTTASLLIAGTCTVQATQPGNSVYAAATPVSQTFTVSLAAQTITFNTLPDQPLGPFSAVTLSAFSSSGLPVQFASTTTTVCTVTGGTVTLLATGTCTIEASQAGDGVTYAAAADVDQSFTVESGSSSTGFGSINVGTTSSAMTISVPIDTSGTLTNVAVLTQGAPSLDFASASGGTCTSGTAYNAGDTCTVNASFTPKVPGTRYGAIVITDGSSNVLGIAYLEGTGVAAQVDFLPGTESTLSTSTLNEPGQIAIDGNGNIYIADSGNARILKETLSNGSYTESVVPTSTLCYPYAVAVDGAGNLYIADCQRVLEESPSGGSYVETVIPTSNLGDAAWVAVDSNGNIYIADDENNQILMETLSNGTYTQTVVTTSSLNAPEAVAVDALGNLYVADSGDSRILRETVSANSASESVISTSPLSWPGAIWVDGYGNIFIADSGNNRILKETPSGSSYSETTVQSSSLNSPYGITTDLNGNIYISDSFNNRVLKEDLSDPPSLTFATTEPGSTSSDSPQMVTVENAGNVALSFPIPSTGNNPSISDGFTLNSTGGGTCPVVTSESTVAGMLGSGQSCALPISFTPSEDGSIQGSLTLTDNALNATSTQSIQLSGTGGDASQMSRFAANAGTVGGSCSPPIIASVLPATWFAGKTYHITIIGANFSNTITSCRNPNGGGMFEGPTQLSIYTQSGAIVPISTLNVLTSSVMMATVTPLSTNPTETATVQAWAPFLDGPPNYQSPSLRPATVLGTPQIKWNGQTSTASQCTLTNGKIVSDGADHCVVVGQKIDLTTNVSKPDGMANIMLPGGLSVSNNVWTAGGTTIGELNLVLPSGATSSQSIAETTLDKPTLTAYWLYPQNNVPVAYKYCAMIPGLSTQDLGAGANCSTPATANFSVEGPSASITAYTSLPHAFGYWRVTPPLSGCHGAQVLVFALPDPGASSCTPQKDAYGIDFQAAGVANVPTSGGIFFWIQLIDVDRDTFSTSRGTTYGLPRSTGLDNTYPYSGDESETEDAPDVTLITNPGWPIYTRTFSARMYLMWKSSIDSNTIAVPIGYSQWSTQGSAKQASNFTWTLSAPGSTSSLYHASSGTDPFHGMPIWSSLATNTKN